MTNYGGFRPHNTLSRPVEPASSPTPKTKRSFSQSSVQERPQRIGRHSDPITNTIPNSSGSVSIKDGDTLFEAGERPRKRRRNGRRSDVISASGVERLSPGQEDELVHENKPTKQKPGHPRTPVRSPAKSSKHFSTASSRPSLSDGDELLGGDKMVGPMKRLRKTSEPDGSLTDSVPHVPDNIVITKSLGLGKANKDTAQALQPVSPALASCAEETEESGTDKAVATIQRTPGFVGPFSRSSFSKTRRRTSTPPTSPQDTAKRRVQNLEPSSVPRSQRVVNGSLAHGGERADVRFIEKQESPTLQDALNEVRQFRRPISRDEFPITSLLHGGIPISLQNLVLVWLRNRDQLQLSIDGDFCDYDIDMSRIAKMLHSSQPGGSHLFLRLRRHHDGERLSDPTVLINCQDADSFARLKDLIKSHTDVTTIAKPEDWFQNRAEREKLSAATNYQGSKSDLFRVNQQKREPAEKLGDDSAKRQRRSRAKMHQSLQDASGNRSSNDIVVERTHDVGSKVTNSKPRQPSFELSRGASGFLTPENVSSRTRRASDRDKSKPSISVPDEPEPEDFAVPYSQSPGLGLPWKHALTFPTQGKHKVTVEFEDLNRLDEGEFLNDSLVQFYLRYLQLELENANMEAASRVYWFNSYFFPTLTSGKGRRINFDAVKRWTRNVDLFQYQYVVVPINESAHWYLVILCNLPELMRAHVVSSDGAVERVEEIGHEMTFETIDHTKGEPYASRENQNAHQSQNMVQHRLHSDRGNGALLDVEASPTHFFKSDGANASRRDCVDLVKDSFPPPEFGVPKAGLSEQDLLATPIRSASSFTESLVASEPSVIVMEDGIEEEQALRRPHQRKRRPPPQVFPPNTPAIITLDSLGQTHPLVHRALKDYLVEEAMDKKGFTPFETTSIKGINAKGIPQQQNFCDCGLYLLGYMDKFVENPQGFIAKALSKNFDEQRDWPKLRPSSMRDDMRSLLFKLHDRDVSDRREQASRKRRLSKLGDAHSASSYNDVSALAAEPAASPDTRSPDQRSGAQVEEIRDTPDLRGAPNSEPVANTSMPGHRTEIEIHQDYVPENPQIDVEEMILDSHENRVLEGGQLDGQRQTLSVQLDNAHDGCYAQLVDAASEEGVGGNREIIDLCLS